MKKNAVYVIAACVVLIALIAFFVSKQKKTADLNEVIEVSEVISPAGDETVDQSNEGTVKSGAAFDIVRVEEDGTMVAAGKGKENESLILMDGEAVMAEIKVNEDGEWVYIPTEALSGGTHEFWLQDSSLNGREESEVVVVNVPERGNGAESLAVLMSSDGEKVTVLQTPKTAQIETVVDVQSVKYSKGRLNIHGKVQNAGKINVYINNTFIGNVWVNETGIWNLKTSYPMKKGVKYTIRADKTDAQGRVSGRVEVPFEISKGLETDKSRRVRVVKGDCLWIIAKHIYGEGHAYVSIYQANKKQIKDPNLIYPNQVFVVPAKPAI